MKRKIVKHGPSSLTISLPMKWVKKNNLHSGDEIEVMEKEKELVISGFGKREEREITISLSKKNKLMKRILIMPYIRGFDVINVLFDSHEVLEFIQRNIDLMFGFEIIEQGAKSCKIKNVAETKVEEFQPLMTRMFNVCSTMLNELLEFLENNDEDAGKRIILMEKTMTRIDLFCRRIINIGGGQFEIRKAGSAYATIRILEEIGDLCTEIAEIMPKAKITNRKKFTAITKDLIEAFTVLRKTKHKGDLEFIYQYKEIEEHMDPLFKFDKKMNPNEISLLLLLRQIAFHIDHLSEEVILWISAK